MEGGSIFPILHVYSALSKCHSPHPFTMSIRYRRAFFGRFILRAFGIPTIARPSPGHGALAHWTPTGWVICLGPPWGKGDTKLKYGKDTDFLEHTRARSAGETFKRVLRARLIGELLGERGNALVCLP